MLSRLSHLPTLEMRVASLDEHLRGPTDEAIAGLDELLEEATQGQSPARLVAVALAVWRARLDDQAQIERLREGARQTPRVAPLFDATPPRHQLHERARVEPRLAWRTMVGCFGPPVGRGFEPWYGFQHERRSHSRMLLKQPSAMGVSSSRHAQVMERVLLGLEPFAVPRLLREPGCDVSTVVALAAHRPAPAALLHEVAVSFRWMPHASVRTALASNPFTPPALVHVLRATLPREALTH